MDQLMPDVPAASGSHSEVQVRQQIIGLFRELPEQQKNLLLNELLDMCSTTTLGFVSTAIVPKVKRDFIGLLPQEIGTKIFSFLNFGTLVDASFVSRAWRQTACADFLWKDIYLRGVATGKISGTLEASGETWRRLFIREHLLRRNWESGNCEVTTLAGHARSVFAVRFEGDRCVSASYDGTLKIWDMDTGQCLRTLVGHTKGVTSVALLGNNRVASSSSDHTIRVWDMSTGIQLAVFEGHTGEVCSISTEGGTLVSGSCDWSVRTWNLETGQQRWQMTEHQDYIISVQIRNGLIVSGSYDATVKLWSAETGACLKTLVGHTGGVKCVAFNDHVIVSGALDRTVRVWDILTGRQRHVFSLNSPVWSVQLEEGTTRLLTTTENAGLRLWDLATTAETTPVLNFHHNNSITSAQFDQSKIVTSSFDKTVKIWRFLEPNKTK